MKAFKEKYSYFFVPYKLKIMDNTTVTNNIDILKPTTYRVSTITCNASITSTINLIELFDNLNLGDEFKYIIDENNNNVAIILNTDNFKETHDFKPRKAYCENKWYDWITIPNYHFNNQYYKIFYLYFYFLDLLKIKFFCIFFLYFLLFILCNEQLLNLLIPSIKSNYSLNYSSNLYRYFELNILIKILSFIPFNIYN